MFGKGKQGEVGLTDAQASWLMKTSRRRGQYDVMMSDFSPGWRKKMLAAERRHDRATGKR